ncbi:jg16469 [Pararge aegeria aegeria]|uniref:Jg16469 protein n=1 Tax=Pararge aegeria aegeria TaxID=348720 RepID=A0A8S4RKT7_9NEOP|nr:jg16469 [Pararge aegeria aegeria]
MGGAELMDVGVPRCWNGDPAKMNAALVGLQRGGQETSNESLGAAGNKRPRTVVSELHSTDLCPADDFNRLKG